MLVVYYMAREATDCLIWDDVSDRGASRDASVQTTLMTT